MKQFTELIFNEYNKIGSFINGNPYTISFIYPKDSDPFVVKGGSNDVEMYLRDFNKIKIPYVKHDTYWRHGTHRRRVTIENLGNGIKGYVSGINKKRTGYFEIILNRSFQRIFRKEVKRIPRKWIKELDQFCEKQSYQSYQYISKNDMEI